MIPTTELRAYIPEDEVEGRETLCRARGARPNRPFRKFRDETLPVRCDRDPRAWLVPIRSLECSFLESLGNPIAAGIY